MKGIELVGVSLNWSSFSVIRYEGKILLPSSVRKDYSLSPSTVTESLFCH
jgi:hypothetical protein